MVTLNVNGIRSAANKGFVEWAESAGADCMGLQELKAQAVDLGGRFDRVAGMDGHFHYAQKKGYSGVGLYGRKAPSDVKIGFDGDEFDAEGRYVEMRYDTPGRRFSVISCYFPSGSSGEERQSAKYRFLDRLYPHLAALKAEREFVLVGDVNIAHQQIDLKNWKGNLKNSGFLPEERAWMTRLLGEAGLVDVYRRLHPDATDTSYTWWSNRGQAYAKNVGWRLDYHLATPGLADKARTVSIYKERKFSDHAPVTIDYDFTL
ncbi:exodeoxyribonuclease III [Pseudorhodoferax sp.]|uniref:exodeoxyribonuclease III n=1 Tax=Pseudorhodoferax sp. TaxID=1993553 RepID=UPI002DD68880|nr:exodeoxyribonuclease III [Pseudorhodoferax sp.]